MTHAVDFYASLPHYNRHIAPVADALERRGVEVRRWSRGGDFAPVLRPDDRNRAELVVVASHKDASERFGDKRVVYVEHGAGQTYVGGSTDAGYAGATKLDHVVLFLCPREEIADRWRAVYPQVAVETVGCPALDQHMSRPVATTDDRVVAFTFHWRCPIVPETMPALPHYRAALPRLLADLSAADVEVVGSAHPKGRGPMREAWAALGVRYEPDPDVVLREASVVVADNTSLMYEAAACDIPVVALNAPWYRREVEHGLRFWSHVPGVQCDEPDRLLDAIVTSLDGAGAEERMRAASHVYDRLDGCASERAAEAIERHCG